MKSHGRERTRLACLLRVGLDEVTAGMAPQEGWVGVEDVAAHHRVAKESIYRWIDSKGFPAHRVGRLLRFELSEVDEWVTASGDDDSASASAKTPEARPEGRKPNVKKKNRHG